MGRKRERAWQEFQARVGQLHAAEASAASGVGGELDYTSLQLQLVALRVMEQGCVFCGALVGHETFGVAYQANPRQGRPELYRYRNVVGCCARCAAAIGSLNAGTWIDILAALKTEQDWVALEFVERLARASAKVLPRPGPACR